MSSPTSASHKARRLGLASRWSRKRAEAEQAIHAMGLEAIPFLLQVIEEQGRWCRRWRPVWMALLSIGGVALAHSFYSLYQDRDLLLDSERVVFWGLWTTGFSTLHQAVSTRLQRHAGALLAKTAGREHVGTLVELLDCTDGDVRNMVRTRLTQIFPQMQASDARYLTAPQRKILVKTMGSFRDFNEHENTDVLIALLKALQQVGDGSFVEPVRQFCYTDSHIVGLELQVAATECLPYLEDFAVQEQKGGTLVRAASSPTREQASARMVRPANSRSHAEPAVLLRSSVQEEAE